MVERIEGDSYYKQFERIELSPTKLNTVFQSYLEQFPGFVIDFSGGDIEGIKEFNEEDINEALLIGAQVFANILTRHERRENPNNAHKKVLLNRMQGFLSRFAHTPGSFDALVIDHLDELYVTGLTELAFVDSRMFTHKLLFISSWRWFI